MNAAVRPVTREHHSNLRWRGISSYRFAASISVVPLAGIEVTSAVSVYPLAFAQQQGAWSLVAVLGTTGGQNLFVTPTGQWAAHYVPAILRAQPFRLGRTEGGDYALCVDHASGLVTEGGEGVPFFDNNGAPTTPIRQVFDFLGQTARSQEATVAACTELARQGVLEPWPLSIRNGDLEHKVEGLSRISESALNGLSDEAFLLLRRAGALPIAYAQLSSMTNVANLSRLMLAHARAQAQQARAAAGQPDNLDQTFGISTSETVDWSAVKWTSDVHEGTSARSRNSG